MAVFSWLRGQSAQEGALPPPPGRRSAVPLLGQTLSFHGAAHDEVTSLVEATECSSVRLNIIARNVALVTAYEDACIVLEQNWDVVPTVSRAQAYEQLMSAFYSSPNLLLEDEGQEGSKEHRQYWETSIHYALQESDVQSRVAGMVDSWLERTTRDNCLTEDLYDACKSLGHDLALGTFLSLDSGSMKSGQDGPSHVDLLRWSEEMLRGQFTLPVG
ncbi:hypothetical protein CBS101457_005577 [Exobasidium rhododendri]|nr:hypothetical protein CBS101457_005577 [Exobasidium rhododendri]